MIIFSRVVVSEGYELLFDSNDDHFNLAWFHYKFGFARILWLCSLQPFTRLYVTRSLG